MLYTEALIEQYYNFSLLSHRMGCINDNASTSHKTSKVSQAVIPYKLFLKTAAMQILAVR